MAAGTSRRRAKAEVEQASFDTSLRLPSLSIRGFRGIEELEIPRLARVTLLAGDNSIGKTTVLDAVRLYAAGGRPEAMGDLLESREEIVETIDEDGDLTILPNWAGLFNADSPKFLGMVSVGPLAQNESETLKIAATEITDDSKSKRAGRRTVVPEPLDSQAGLKVDFRGETLEVHPEELGLWRQRRRLGRGWSPRRSVRAGLTGLRCLLLGPGAPDSEETAKFWDEVALTDVEDRVLSALEIVAGSGVERIAVLGGEEREIPVFRNAGRRVMVKLQNREQRTPLKSLGDGAFRLFTLALALAYCRDGFLLVDEAENGIHYSHHEAYWRMVIETAIRNNIQVFATTHSFDCIRGFSKAAKAVPEENGIMVRLSRDESGKIRATEYSEELLDVAGELGIEVR